MIVFRAKVGVDIQYIETIRGKQKVVGDLRNINSKGYTKILQEYYRDYCFDKSDAQPIYSKYKLCFIDIMVDSNNNMRSYPPLIVDYDDDGNPYVYLRFMYTKATFTCDWVDDKDPVKSITTKKETRDFIKDIFEKYLTYYPESPSTEKRYIAKANTIDYIEEYKGQLFITYASIFSDWCFNCQPTYISYGEDEIEEGDFAKNATVINTISSIDSKHPCYINLYPNWAWGSIDSYEYKLVSYVSSVPVKFLSFDQYPIIQQKGEISLREYWYKNLEDIRRVSRAKNMPFWAFALSLSHQLGDILYPVPTLGHIRLQMFSNLAYGAQGFQYFTYWGIFHDEPTEVYDIVKTVNKELQYL